MLKTLPKLRNQQQHPNICVDTVQYQERELLLCDRRKFACLITGRSDKGKQ